MMHNYRQSFINIFSIINSCTLFNYHFNKYIFEIDIIIVKTNSNLTKQGEKNSRLVSNYIPKYYSSSFTASSSTSLFCTSPGTSSYVEGDIMKDARPPVSELNVVE